jgi:hypothetical protein
MIKNKFKASLIHLVLSAVIISALVSLIIIYWFPSPFLGVTNFKDIALILILIDLVLGPLLTFIVFNPNKKSLKFDLSVIVSIQFIALSYGLYMLYLSHPLYITYYENSFNIVTAKQANPEKANHTDLKISKLSSPIFAYLDITDDATKDQLFKDMVDGDADIEARTEYYKPYKNHLDTILANSLDADKIFSKSNMNEESKSFLKKNQNIDSFAFLPLLGSSSNAIIVLNKKTGKAVTTIQTDPWKYAKK